MTTSSRRENDTDDTLQLDLLDKLPPLESLEKFVQTLEEENELEFDAIIEQPLGQHLFTLHANNESSGERMQFINDVKIFKKVTDNHALEKFAMQMWMRYFTEDDSITGSIFEASDPDGATASDYAPLDISPEQLDQLEAKIRDGPSAKETKRRAIFDDIYKETIDDLRASIYPKFKESVYFSQFIRCKTLEKERVSRESFEFGPMLGRGAFGMVNRCTRKKTGKIYAVKCIDKKTVKYNKSSNTILTEKNLLCKMDSRFVTGLAYSYKDATHLYMVIDLKEGGDLKFHLNKEILFSEERARFYAAQTLLGLEHIHSHGIIYRDMKLENVLLDRYGNCSLSDLGLAVAAKQVRKGYAGTPGYTAPEMVAQHPYDKRVDFFSYGVMVFRFLSGKKPFDVRHREKAKKNRRKQTQLDQSVLKRHPEFQPKYFSPRAKDLLTNLLRKDPNKRLGKDGIDTIKKHPWFQEIDFVLLSTGSVDAPFKPNVRSDSAQQQQRGARRDKKLDSVKLTPEFEDELQGFDSVSHVYVQNELVEILKQRAERSPEFDKFPSVDTSQFEIGDTVLFRGSKGKAELKEGIVTSLKPLKVKGKGHWFSRRYSYVIKKDASEETQTFEERSSPSAKPPSAKKNSKPTSSIPVEKVEKPKPSPKSSPVSFQKGEEVLYRSKPDNEYKVGYVTSVQPLKVKGKGHWFSARYNDVIKKSGGTDEAVGGVAGEQTIDSNDKGHDDHDLKSEEV